MIQNNSSAVQLSKIAVVLRFQEFYLFVVHHDPINI